MAKPLSMGILPLTNKICVGTLAKNGTMWGANRQDVTEDAISCVAQYLHKANEVRTFVVDGVEYDLSFTKTLKET